MQVWMSKEYISAITCLPHGPPCPMRPSSAVVNRLVSYNRCAGSVSTGGGETGSRCSEERRAQGSAAGELEALTPMGALWVSRTLAQRRGSTERL